MDIRLTGRKALITGGSAGLGKAMASAFAAAGADVALIARGEERLMMARDEIAAASGRAVHAYVCDVADGGQIEATYTRAVADLGQVDILVNNAGQSATGAFAEIDDATWQADIDLKLMSAVRLCRLAFPDMRGRRWGRIINVLNTHAKAAGGGSAPTSVTRAAGMALTKVLSKEGAADNVLVNAMLVGLIESDQWRRRHNALDDGRSYDDFLADFAAERRLPMGRLGEAAEFANLACFLVSDAGGYITGTAINVDGGLSPVV